MKIGIDGTPLTIPFPCGVKHYATELINAISRVDKKNQYVIFTPKKVKLPARKNFSQVIVKSPLPFFKRQTLLNRYTRNERIDVFHYLEPFGSVFFKHPNIITTINDVNLDFVFPKLRSLKFFLKRYYCELTRYFVSRHTKSFISISDYTGAQLKKYLRRIGIKDRIVTTIYDAASGDYRNKNLKRENFFLCLGDFSPRKNIKSAIEAFSLLPEQIRQIYGLYIIVSAKEELPKFQKTAKKFKVSEKIKFRVAVSNEELVKLYNKAKFFVYPSLYEGFGLPIVEAMACGCPVITSNFGATKEVAGMAAMLVDTKDPKKISEAMTKLIGSDKLQRKLSLSGLKRAREFSWEQTAKSTVSLYERTFSTN